MYVMCHFNCCRARRRCIYEEPSEADGPTRRSREWKDSLAASPTASRSNEESGPTTPRCRKRRPGIPTARSELSSGVRKDILAELEEQSEKRNENQDVSSTRSKSTLSQEDKLPVSVLTVLHSKSSCVASWFSFL